MEDKEKRDRSWTESAIAGELKKLEELNEDENINKPGSPWENPFIESFNGTFRGECLDRWVFTDGREAQAVIEQCRHEYNHRRPHSSLGYLPPVVFADQARLTLNLVWYMRSGQVQ